MVFILFHICDKTYTKRDDADDAVDGRVCAFPENRQANYPTTTQITPNYPRITHKMEANYLQVT